jgi:hypothetical protein
MRTELIASTAIVANGNTNAFALDTDSTLAIGVDITAGSGTVAFDLWLQVSDDGGTTWYDMPADLVLKSANSASAGTVAANSRDIVDGKTTTTAEQFIGIYKSLASDRFRLKWILTGSSPSLTLSASAMSK